MGWKERYSEQRGQDRRGTRTSERSSRRADRDREEDREPRRRHHWVQGTEKWLRLAPFGTRDAVLMLALA